MEDHSATSNVLRRRRRCQNAALLPLMVISVGCSNFVGTTAKSFMTHIRTDPDPNKRYLAYASLGKRDLFETPEQKSQAVDLLIKKLEEGKEPLGIRAVICRTLGDLNDPRARNALIKAIGHPEGVLRSEACRALGKIGHADDASLLARVMTIDNLEDCRMAAIEGLGEMKSSDPRIIQVLIEGMEHDDPAIRMASLTSLRKISGTDLGIEPDPWRKHYATLFAKGAEPSPAQAKGGIVFPKKLATDAGEAKKGEPAAGGKTKKIDPGVVKSQQP